MPKDHYDKAYGDFVRMTIINESAHKHAIASLREMHEMADMLMKPPDFQSPIQLYSR